MKIIKREPSNTMPYTEMWTVKPDHLDQVFLVSISVPQGEAPEEGWAGSVCTDGNTLAGPQQQTLFYLGMGGTFSPTVAVSIGYPLNNDMPFIVARNQHLTPTHWPEWDATYAKVLQLPTPASGGATEFLSFINDELKPAIERECSVNPDEWTLVGHSLGGLFVTHAILTDPERFSRYLGFGSSHWWRGGEQFAQAEAFAKAEQPLDIAIYLAAGELESRAAMSKEWEPMANLPDWVEYLRVMDGVPDIAGDTVRMIEILGRRAGVTATSDILHNETHGTAVGAALSQGFRRLNS